MRPVLSRLLRALFGKPPLAIAAPERPASPRRGPLMPRQSIKDRTFRYVPSQSTDIRERFQAERERLRQLHPGARPRVEPLRRKP